MLCRLRFYGANEMTKLIFCKLTCAVAMVVVNVDVSNESSFRHVDHELTVADLCRINSNFEGGQHISRSRFTHDVVGSVYCLRVDVCHKLHWHMESCWHWDIQRYTQTIIGHRRYLRCPLALVWIRTCSIWAWQKLQRISYTDIVTRMTWNWISQCSVVRPLLESIGKREVRPPVKS